MVLVFLIYGAAFFALGLSLLIYPKKDSTFGLAANLWMIAAFGLTHGLNEWVDMFMLIADARWAMYLKAARFILLPASFYFLLRFGVKTLAVHDEKFRRLRVLPIVLPAAWVGIVLWSGNKFLAGDVFGRYLLAFPGSALTAVALLSYLREFKGRGVPEVMCDIRLSAGAFGVYAVISGLIVPQAEFAPASFLNYVFFREAVGVPVQVFRAVCAVTISYGMVRTLSIFYWESKAVLKNSEERFRNSFENAPIGIGLLSTEGKWLRVNESLCSAIGYSSDELLSMDLQSVTHPEDFKDCTKCMGELLAHKTQSCQLEKRFIHKGGRPIYVQANMSLVRDSRNNALYFISQVQDIFARKRMEDELISRHAELSALFKVSSVLGQTIELKNLLDEALDVITGLELFNVQKKGGIFVVEGEDMHLISHIGASEEFLNLHKNFKRGSCLCGIAAVTGNVIVSDNSSHDDRHTVTYANMPPHGHIVVPLKVKDDKVVGVLYLYLPPDVKVDEHRTQLLVSIGNQIGIAIENSKLYEKTKELSLHDPLTGLANRRLLDILLDDNIAKAKRLATPFSLVMLDIDLFKRYNDTYGHPEGDTLLVKVARTVAGEIRATDLLVRFGGEEFVILFPNTEIAKAHAVAERIRNAVETKTPVTISMGVASYAFGLQKEDILSRADGALYHAKQGGRNRVELSG